MDHELLNAWKALKRMKGPLMLQGDRPLLTDPKCSDMLWERDEKAFRRSDMLIDAGNRLFLNLVPVPYAGKIFSASVYILQLNPGFSNLDIFAEEISPAFRQALLAQLNGQQPNLFFNPKFHWTGGFSYWTGKLREQIECLRQRYGKSVQEVFELMADEVAFLELVPYHSQKFGLPESVVNQLESVRLMQGFVRDVVLPRAEDGECSVVITRQRRMWGVRRFKNVTIYEPQEARGAHLTLGMQGGRRIMRRLDAAAKIKWS